ncbi:hypothetical protein, partial [Enterococcus casseliflavus]|uniref:hypothetical protein n=1 Tax=Enterococcus casseliflavus TaxID=37734 RepID=UPI003A4C5F8C
LRLNKVKNIKTAYRISVDSRQNNFILFHCPLDGEPSILVVLAFHNDIYKTVLWAIVPFQSAE